ncbi:hypothetical protein M5D96_013531 [Drosophila gunungcola]|uniref:Glutaredoxin domain-containing protein n=1 Tax=Drosophila gunungcola TaxID=103775 RepID=A0A9P9YB67_9MUSC|nr:hypothetical protein M5D96_013531 [Drosophila gunungcola]
MRDPGQWHGQRPGGSRSGSGSGPPNPPKPPKPATAATKGEVTAAGVASADHEVKGQRGGRQQSSPEGLQPHRRQRRGRREQQLLAELRFPALRRTFAHFAAPGHSTQGKGIGNRWSAGHQNRWQTSAIRGGWLLHLSRPRTRQFPQLQLQLVDGVRGARLSGGAAGRALRRISGCPDGGQAVRQLHHSLGQGNRPGRQESCAQWSSHLPAAAAAQCQELHGKGLGQGGLYTTSMGIIRKTYAKCANVKQILRTLLIKFEERDIFMSVEYQQEMRERMHDETIRVPQLFVEGQHIGDADTVERLNESGELRQLLKPYKSIATAYTCQTCGGYRLLPCPSCSGSKKSVHRNHFTAEFVALKCMNCDEVGLVKCPNC